MAINRLVAPADPPTADTNWTQLINWVKLALLSIELPFRMDWENARIKKGAIFYVSGTPYLCDTDVLPTGISSLYVKLTPSGDGSVLTASYAANLNNVTWNTTYNGWYDAATPACLYIFDNHLAVANGVITVARDSRDTDFLRHNNINIGLTNDSSGDYGISIGSGNTSSETFGLTIGRNCTASAGNSIAQGNSSTASALESVAIGAGMISNRENETAIGGIRKEVYLSTEHENAVFDSLYALLGSNSTPRILSAVGSFGTSAVAYIAIASASLITIQLSTGSKTLTNGTETDIGSTLKLMFIDGIY